MILISKDDVQNMLIETPELSAYAFKILDKKLSKIEVRAVISDCNRCVGASFGDCDACKKLKAVE